MAQATVTSSSGHSQRGLTTSAALDKLSEEILQICYKWELSIRDKTTWVNRMWIMLFTDPLWNVAVVIAFLLQQIYFIVCLFTKEEQHANGGSHLSDYEEKIHISGVYVFASAVTATLFCLNFVLLEWIRVRQRRCVFSRVQKICRQMKDLSQHEDIHERWLHGAATSATSRPPTGISNDKLSPPPQRLRQCSGSSLGCQEEVASDPVSAYPGLHLPTSPCVHMQWTYRDGYLVNLPVALLVQSDVVLLRPGHAVQMHCDILMSTDNDDTEGAFPKMHLSPGMTTSSIVDQNKSLHTSCVEESSATVVGTGAAGSVPKRPQRATLAVVSSTPMLNLVDAYLQRWINGDGWGNASPPCIFKPQSFSRLPVPLFYLHWCMLVYWICVGLAHILFIGLLLAIRRYNAHFNTIESIRTNTTRLFWLEEPGNMSASLAQHVWLTLPMALPLIWCFFCTDAVCHLQRGFRENYPRHSWWTQFLSAADDSTNKSGADDDVTERETSSSMNPTDMKGPLLEHGMTQEDDTDGDASYPHNHNAGYRKKSESLSSLLSKMRERLYLVFAGDQDPLWWKLFFTLATVSSVCCLDKKGMLSYPLATPEKVFFFRRRHRQSTYQLGSQPNGLQPSDSVVPPRNHHRLSTASLKFSNVCDLPSDVNAHLERCDLTKDVSHHTNLYGEHLHAGHPMHSLNPFRASGTALSAGGSIHDTSVLGASCLSHGVILELGVHLHPDKQSRGLHTSSAQIPAPVAPYMPYFVDQRWQRYLSSLKAIGLNILLNNCNPHAMPRYTQFSDHLLSLVDKRSMREDEATSCRINKVAVVNRRCLCGLSVGMGFRVPQAVQHFHLEAVISGYRPAGRDSGQMNFSYISNDAKTEDGVNDLFGEAPWRKQSPMPNIFSAVTTETLGGGYQLMTQGTGDLLADVCSYYWDGSNISPLSVGERSRILDFYHRNVFSAYCIGFAYAPLLSKLPKLRAHLDSSTSSIAGVTRHLIEQQQSSQQNPPLSTSLEGLEVSQSVHLGSDPHSRADPATPTTSPISCKGKYPQYPLTVLEFPPQDRHHLISCLGGSAAVSGFSNDHKWRQSHSVHIMNPRQSCESSGQQGIRRIFPSNSNNPNECSSPVWNDKVTPSSSGFVGNLASRVFGVDDKDPTLRLTFSVENLLESQQKVSTNTPSSNSSKISTPNSIKKTPEHSSDLARDEKSSALGGFSREEQRCRYAPVLEEENEEDGNNDKEEDDEEEDEDATFSQHANFSNACLDPPFIFDDEANQLQEVLSGQVFLGMVSMQYQALSDVVMAIDKLHEACIRFVHFSSENQLRSRIFAERLGLESGWNCHISLQDPETETREESGNPDSSMISNHPNNDKVPSYGTATNITATTPAFQSREFVPGEDKNQSPHNMVSVRNVDSGLPPLVKCLYTTQESSERMRFNSDPHIFMTMKRSLSDSSELHVLNKSDVPTTTTLGDTFDTAKENDNIVQPESHILNISHADPNGLSEIRDQEIDEYHPIAFVAGKDKCESSSSPAHLHSRPNGRCSSWSRTLWSPLWNLIQQARATRTRNSSHPNLSTHLISTEYGGSHQNIQSATTDSEEHATTLPYTIYSDETEALHASATSLCILETKADEPPLLTPHPSLASSFKTQNTITSSPKISADFMKDLKSDKLLENPVVKLSPPSSKKSYEKVDDIPNLSHSSSGHSRSTSGSKTSLTNNEEDEPLMKFIKRDMSKLPQGIANIREHLKNVDNVPLLVSLFTDSSPETVRSMVDILQESGGDIVLTVGSSLSLHNFKVHVQADSGLSMIPLLAPICVQHLLSSTSSSSPTTTNCQTSPQRGQHKSTERRHQKEQENQAQRSSQSTPYCCPTPVELASQLLSLPCAVLTQRERGLPLLGGITSSRLYFARFLNGLSFFLCCHLSLLLWGSLLLMLASIHHVLPPNSMSHHTWSLLLGSTKFIHNTDNNSISCCTADTSFSLPVHLLPPYALTLLSWCVVPLLTMALLWGNTLTENDTLRKKLWSRPPRKRTKLITRKIIMRIMLANVARFLPTVLVCVLTTLLNWVSFEIRRIQPGEETWLSKQVAELAGQILSLQDMPLSDTQRQEMSLAARNQSMPLLSIYGSDAVISVVSGFALVQLTLYLCEIALCYSYALDSGQRIPTRQCPSLTWFLVFAFLFTTLTALLLMTWIPYPNRLLLLYHIHFSMYILLWGWFLILPFVNAYINYRERSSILAEHRLAKLYFGTKLGMYSPV